MRAERIRVQLSTRDVERLSRQIADQRQSRDFYISHAWLTDAENGSYVPSMFKIHSLSVIYKRRYDEILAFFGLDMADLGREQISLPLPRTHLIGHEGNSPMLSRQIPDEMRKKVDFARTNLVSHMFSQWGGIPVALLGVGESDKSAYGYVGTEDFTLFPLIRPGSFVQIDASQKKIDSGGWKGEVDRPIYFVQLRGGYACSWCESGEGKLLLVPCPQSSRQVREVRFPGDADIVGRVTAVSMRIAE